MSGHQIGEEPGLKRKERLKPKPNDNERHLDGAGRFHHFAGVFEKRPDISSDERKMIDAVAELVSGRRVREASAYITNEPTANGPGVPAGYTYLYQFAAHDLVHTENRSVPTNSPGRWPLNRRLKPLALETLYGGGASNCPTAYSPSLPGEPQFLRMGLTREEQISSPGKIFAEPAPSGVGLTDFDIPRLSKSLPVGATEELTSKDPLISDPRNDDNLLLSQMVVLWSRIHNAISVKIASSTQMKSKADNIFQLARDVLILIYRRILVHDFLMRVLHPAIWAHYVKKPNTQLDNYAGDDSVSFEFAYGAARLAHSMVRPRYMPNNDFALDLEDIVDITSAHEDPNKLTSVPISSDRLVDWRNFFETPSSSNNKKFQWALRFGPHIAQGIEGGRGKLKNEVVVRRDQRRAINARVAPAKDLATEMELRAPNKELSELYRKSSDIAKVMDQFWNGPHNLLSGVVQPQTTHLADIQSFLSKTPPFPLYLACEALAYGDEGRRMGPVGSTLVAEAFKAAFNDKKRKGDYFHRRKLVVACATEILPGKNGKPLADMTALLEFLRRAEPTYQHEK